MLSKLTIKAWLLYLAGLMALLLIGAGGVGVGSLGATEAELKAVYASRMGALEQLEQMAALIDSNQLMVVEAVAAQYTAALTAQRSETVQRDVARIDALWKSYLEKAKTAEERRFAEAFAADRQRYERQGLLPALSALGAHRFDLASELLHGPMGVSYPAVQHGVDALIALQREAGKAEIEAGAARNATVRRLAVAALLLGALLAVAVGAGLARAAVRPLRAAGEAAHPAAPADAGSNDEAGRQLVAMQERLTDTLTRIKEVSGVIGTVSHEIAAVNAAARERMSGADPWRGGQATAEGLAAEAARLAEAARFIKPRRAGIAASERAREPGRNVVPLRPRAAPDQRRAEGSGGDNESEAF